MDPALGSTISPLALILGIVLSLAVLFAQLRLFSIDGSLKKLVARVQELQRSIDGELIGEECPHCGGRMVSGKSVCRHCGRDVRPNANSTTYRRRRRFVLFRAAALALRGRTTDSVGGAFLAAIASPCL